jgi:DNA-binding HxlR family transcriptional regulator
MVELLRIRSCQLLLGGYLNNESESVQSDIWRDVQVALGEEYLSAAGPAKMQDFSQLIAAASQTGHDPAGPVREVQSLVGDRWSGLLLPLLHFGPLRFSTLQKIVGLTDEEPISRRMLSYKLRALERDGFVRRTAKPDSSQRVEYSLTALGEAFHPVFLQLIHWLTEHNAEIEAARREFAQHDSDADVASGDS